MACLTAVVGIFAAGYQSARADGAGWFSSAQVASGGSSNGYQCSVCERAQLHDVGRPSLIGRTLVRQGSGKSNRNLYEYVHQNMPLGKRDSLDSHVHADIFADIPSRNGLPAGTQQFTTSSPMSRILSFGAAPLVLNNLAREAGAIRSGRSTAAEPPGRRTRSTAQAGRCLSRSQ